MSMFADHFWGDKHIGFDTLCLNLKHGEQSCKDLEDFVKQCSNVEEMYVKALTRLLKNIGSYNTSGSFAPVWQAVKGSFEKLSSSHTELSKKWKELANEIHKYFESLGKKYKTIKDGQSSTHETVQSMQSIATLLSKSKESYNSKFNDYKKVLVDKSTAKKLERSETEFKKATDDYKLNVAKYNSTLEEYKKKMGESTDLFQETEVEYLSHLEQFVRKFASLRDDKHTEIGELHYEFHTNLTELSVECLLDTFIETKGTGTEAPVPVTFEEADLASLPPPPTPQEEALVEVTESPTPAPTTSSMMHLNITGIFKRKKKKKNADKDNDSNHDVDSMDKVSNTSQPEVDEEGYRIRRESKVKEDDSWDSSSDSGSDTEEKTRSKLKVNIKPLNVDSPAGAGFEGLRIGSANLQNNHVTSTPESTSANTTTELMDLLGSLSPRSTDGSRAVTPFDLYKRTTPVSWTNVPSTDTHLTAEDKEVLDTWRNSNTNSNPAVQSPVIPGLPRPPSRKDIANNNSGRISAGRFSPMSSMMTRPSDTFSQPGIQTFAAAPNGVDAIPVAVAFTEALVSKFRGADHESQVSGEVMMSFPVEILSRDSLPKLSFKLAGRSAGQVKVHSDLISSEGDVHSFNGSALLGNLKMRQSKDPACKHFNVAIARYTLNVTCVPLKPTVYWKCEQETTDLRVEYEYVGSALRKPLPLTSLQFLVPVNGGVSNVQTMPEGAWSQPHEKLLWKVPELKSGVNSKGNLKARFSLKAGPGNPASVAVQFCCDGTMLSGTEFELSNTNYRVSLTKKRMQAKLMVDTDKLVTYV